MTSDHFDFPSYSSVSRITGTRSCEVAGAYLERDARSTILNVAGTPHVVSPARRAHWLVLIIHGSVRYRQSQLRIPDANLNIKPCEADVNNNGCPLSVRLSYFPPARARAHTHRVTFT